MPGPIRVLAISGSLSSATEMVGKLLQWAAGQVGVGGVEAETTAENRASVRVLERNGFRVVRAEGGTGSVRYLRP